MIRTLTAIALFAAVAAPAAAADIKVNIAGKDMATVEALLKDASRSVCRDELQGWMGALQTQASCETAVFADAMKQALEVSSTLGKATTVAKASPAAEPLAVTRISN